MGVDLGMVLRWMTKRSSSLQRLFVACRDVFKGPGTVLHPAYVTKLHRILGTCFFPTALILILILILIFDTMLLFC